MESNFTLRYEWLDTVDSGWPKSEYLCGLGLVLFAIGRWTHLDTFQYATIKGYHVTRYPLWPDLKILIYAMLLVAVTQPTYNYSVQICYNGTNALGHTTNITNDCACARWLPAPSSTGAILPDFDRISILASALYHAIHDCYCCLSFPSKLFTFLINLCLWEW